METLRLACWAMATRFELVLCGENPLALRAAGEAALREIERLEARLSRFRSDSEIAHLNARAAHEPVRVAPDLFALLRRATQLTRLTDGAFDITVGPLLQVWGVAEKSNAPPTAEALAQARANVGADKLLLDECERTVRFGRAGVTLDLGAIGKGYALDCAMEILRDAGVTNALVHGGTSTIFALGRPPDAHTWKVAIGALPVSASEGSIESAPAGILRVAPDESSRSVFDAVDLRDEALSISAVWGRWWRVGNRRHGHVVDPRTGEPVRDSLLAAVVWSSATEADALSTALLTLGRSGKTRLHERFPGLRSWLITTEDWQVKLPKETPSVNAPLIP